MLELSLPIPNTILRRETATIVRRSYPPYGLASPTISERSLGYSKISIRRLSVRPSSVSLLATGLVSAKPTASRLSRFTPPRSMKNRTTFVARAVDNSQFVGNFSRSFTPIGTLSVCPSIRICLRSKGCPLRRFGTSHSDSLVTNATTSGELLRDQADSQDRVHSPRTTIFILPCDNLDAAQSEML